MTDTRFYEPARLSTPRKPLFSLKSLDAYLVDGNVCIRYLYLSQVIKNNYDKEATDSQEYKQVIVFKNCRF